MAIASRVLGVPVRWTEDRGEHLLAASMATERTSEVEAAFAADGRLLGAAARPDRRGRRLRPRARAGHALPHARLPDRRLRRAGPRRAQPRRRQQPRAVRPQPRLRRPAALQRARAHDVHRRAAARDRPRRARAPQPRARRADALPRRGRGRSTTPATTRRCLDDALELAGYDELRAEQARGARPRAACSASGSPAWSSRASPTWATSRSCRRAEERAAGLPEERQRRGRRRSRWARTAASRCASRRRRRARATAPWRRRSRPTCSASSPSRSTCAPTPTRPPTRGRCRPATTRAASRRWAPRAVHLAATRLADRLRALAAPVLGCATGGGRARRGPGARARRRGAQRLDPPPRRRRALAPERPHGRGRRGARADRHLHAAHLAARTTTTASTRRPATASSPTSCVVEIDPETAEVAVRSYVTVHDAGRLLNPLLADGQIRGGLAHGLGAALLEEHRYDEDGNLMTGDVPRLPAADRDRAAARRLGAPRVALAAHAARREGPRRGQHDERAGRDRQRRRRRARRRRASSCRRRRSASGSCCEAVAPAARAPALAGRGARAAGRARRRRQAHRRRAEPRAAAQLPPRRARPCSSTSARCRRSR